jgi:hypothetical protein
MLVVKLKNDHGEGRTRGFSIILPDGRDLLTIIPVKTIEFSHTVGEMPEMRLELDSIGVKHDLLCTLDVEDIVRQIRELEQEKVKNPHWE